MAEEKTTEEGTEEKGKKKNLLLFIVIGVLVLLLIGGGLLAFFLLSGDDPQANQMPPQQQQQEAGGGEGGGGGTSSNLLTVGPMYPLDQFIVNLMTQGGKRYLKVTITLELSDNAMVSEIEKKHAVLRDILIGAMSSKTVEEISTSRGKNKLKEELIARVNEVLTDGYIKNMFFTDFVIQ
ncbi:MAG: flagellar basal body-associated protein FliL [Campylobacterales bacterium]